MLEVVPVRDRPASEGRAEQRTVGEVDGAAASAVLAPPNPNAGLDMFLGADPNTGQVVFNTASWTSYLQSGASWAAASWASASWAEASWASASWAQASWSAASWTGASWADASWAQSTDSQSTDQE